MDVDKKALNDDELDLVTGGEGEAAPEGGETPEGEQQEEKEPCVRGKTAMDAGCVNTKGINRTYCPYVKPIRGETNHFRCTQGYGDVYCVSIRI